MVASCHCRPPRHAASTLRQAPRGSDLRHGWNYIYIFHSAGSSPRLHVIGLVRNTILHSSSARSALRVPVRLIELRLIGQETRLLAGFSFTLIFMHTI